MFGQSHLTPTKKNSVCTPPPQIDFAGETASAAPKFKNKHKIIILNGAFILSQGQLITMSELRAAQNF